MLKKNRWIVFCKNTKLDYPRYLGDFYYQRTMFFCVLNNLQVFATGWLSVVWFPQNYSLWLMPSNIFCGVSNHNRITIKVIHHRLDKELCLLLIRQSRVRFIDFRSYFTGVKEIVNTPNSKKMHLITINQSVAKLNL